MNNIAAITASLISTFQADATLASDGFIQSRITRGDYMNMDPNKAPWLGVYRTGVSYKPGRLGSGNPDAWDSTIEIKLVVQASHRNSGDACEDRLELYIKHVLESVWSDPTWQATVDILVDMKVDYSYKRDDTSTIYFQWAMISLTAEVSAG